MSFWAIFYLFTPLTTHKIKILKKSKNHMEMVYQKSWYVIWCVTDIFFCHFRPFFALSPHYWARKLKIGRNVKKDLRHYPFTHVYHKWRSYDVWFLGYKARQPKFFVILGHSLPLTLLTNWKIRILKKSKKPPEDIVILHLCTTNDNHMMHGSWDIERNR